MSPESLNLLIGLNLLIAMVVGGMRSLIESLLGGAFYVFLPEVANSVGATQSGVINIVTGASVLIIVPCTRRGGQHSLPCIGLAAWRPKRRSVMGHRVPKESWTITSCQALAMV